MSIKTDFKIESFSAIFSKSYFSNYSCFFGKVNPVVLGIIMYSPAFSSISEKISLEFSKFISSSS